MQSTALALASIGCVIGVSVLCILLLNRVHRDQHNSMMTLMQEERSAHRTSEAAWIRERELLMNRVMTKEWTSYQQMAGSLRSDWVSDDPPVGMNDDEELRRAGLDSQGFGDILLDEADEFKDALTSS